MRRSCWQLRVCGLAQQRIPLRSRLKRPYKMGIKTRRTTTYTVSQDDREFEVRFQPVEFTDPVIRILPDGLAVVGYLSQDESSNNPLDECDSMGKIYDGRNRSGNSQKYWEARGLDSKSREETGKKNPFGILLDVYEHSGEVWRVMGSGRYFPDEQWDVSHGAGIWVPDEACLEHIKQTAKANVGKLPGYDKKILRAEELRIAAECAQQAVDEYNKWLAGEVYGICLETFDKDDKGLSDEASWGYFGTDYAKEEVESGVAAEIKHLEQEKENDENGV